VVQARSPGSLTGVPLEEKVRSFHDIVANVNSLGQAVHLRDPVLGPATTSLERELQLVNDRTKDLALVGDVVELRTQQFRTEVLLQPLTYREEHRLLKLSRHGGPPILGGEV
jgi:hypothetical protein